MTLSRVSTFAMFQSTLRDASATMNQLFKLQNQLSSGLKSSTYDGIADQTQQLLDLESKMSRGDAFAANNSLVATRLSATSSALDQIVGLATAARNLVVSRRSNAMEHQVFDAQLEQHWKTLASQLNTSSEGRYLFAGTSTDSPAVSTDFPAFSEDGPTEDYYLGSNDDVTVRAEDGIEFVYNMRANADSIKTLVAGLAQARQASIDHDDAAYAAAYDLITEGLTGVTIDQAAVNANKVTLETVNDRHASFKLYWQGVKEEISNTDIVSVSTQVAVNQGILQASFQAFARINSLRLSDFLR